MQVQIKKGRDSRPTLVCIRADGSRTWSKMHPFFPIHDLTHYAVENVLEFHEAFFGLIASGWDLTAFEDRNQRAQMPAEALWAENIVGSLDVERATGQRLSAREFSRTLAASLAQQGAPAFRAVTEAELGAIRALRAELQERWLALDPGATLELCFPAPPTA